MPPSTEEDKIFTGKISHEILNFGFSTGTGLHADIRNAWDKARSCVNEECIKKLQIIPRYKEFFLERYKDEETANYVVNKSDPALVLTYNVVVSAFNNSLEKNNIEKIRYYAKLADDIISSGQTAEAKKVRSLCLS